MCARRGTLGARRFNVDFAAPGGLVIRIMLHATHRSPSRAAKRFSPRGLTVVAAWLATLAVTNPGEAAPSTGDQAAAEGPMARWAKELEAAASAQRWSPCLTPDGSQEQRLISSVLRTWQAGDGAEAAPVLVSAACNKLVFTVGSARRLTIGRSRDGSLLGGGLAQTPASWACVQARRAALVAQPAAKAIIEAIEAKHQEWRFDLDIGPYKYLSCGDDQLQRDITLLHESQHGLDRDGCFFSAVSGQWRCLGGIYRLPLVQPLVGKSLGLAGKARTFYKAPIALYLHPTTNFRGLVSELAAYTVSARMHGLSATPNKNLTILPLICLLHVRYLRALKTKHPAWYALLAPSSPNRAVLDALLGEAEDAITLAFAGRDATSPTPMQQAENAVWAAYVRERDELRQLEHPVAP